MKKIKLLLKQRLTDEGFFDGIQVKIKGFNYNKPIEVNYLQPLSRNEPKSDTLELHFGKNSKGIVFITVDSKLEYQKERLIKVNKFRKKKGLPLLKNLD